ncbi:MAG: hypothetical protein PHS82_03330 [Lachnospiraceae bacterium]|nr:hypothetical protein [Lachnospiraceae bacterium]
MRYAKDFRFRAWMPKSQEMLVAVNLHEMCLLNSGAGVTRSAILMQYVGAEDCECKPVFESDYLSDGFTIWEVQYIKSQCGFSAKAVAGAETHEWFSLWHLLHRHNEGRKVRIVGNKWEYTGPLSELLERGKS